MIENRKILESLKPFCDPGVNIQAQEHIRPFHAYTAIRLVLEGGFVPETLLPSPPFGSTHITNRRYRIRLDPGRARTAEATVFGGLRTKQIDLAVLAEGAGPTLGISFKTTSNAFRNIPNRIEELLGDTTNVHLRYPAFTYGFVHIIKLVRESEAPSKNDASFTDDDQPLPSIASFHNVLVNITGRQRITDPPGLYEAVALLVVEPDPAGPIVHADYPPKDSPVHYGRFFDTLYRAYDERFCYVGSDTTYCRKEWILASDMPTADLKLEKPQDTAGPFPYNVALEG